jgi:hypothetical protein
MINFRYHVVSLVAVLFALGTGLVLGSGLLSSGTGTAAAVQVVDLQAEAALLRERVADAEATLAFSDAYGAAVQPGQISDALADRAVLVVALPDADDQLLSDTREALGAAGASVTGTITVLPEWTDAGSAAVLDSLSAQLVTSGASLPDTGSDGYERGAVVLAASVLEPAGSTETAPEAVDTTPAAFVEAGLVEMDEPLRGTAELAVVVAGAPVADDGEAGRRLGALSALAAAVDAAGSGAVLAGAPETARDGGVLLTVRETPELAGAVSTVDMLSASAGRTSTVLALAEQLDGGVGHYGGVGDVDGPLPPTQ